MPASLFWAALARRMPIRFLMMGAAFVVALAAAGTVISDWLPPEIISAVGVGFDVGGLHLLQISKQTLRIERFHGKSERKVKQELFAHFVLITMTRLFSNHGEDLLEAGRERPAGKKLKVNFRSAMQTLGRHLEALLLRQAKLVRDVTLHVFDSIVHSRQAERPGRSYPRVSRRPIGKWKPGKPAKATASAYGGEPCRA